jgi:hypothetical protein
MNVYAAGPDREGVSWRVEVHNGGRVRVFRRTGRSVSQTPLRRPTNVNDLGASLVERGLSADDLEQC